VGLLLFQYVLSTVVLHKQDLARFDIVQTFNHDTTSFTEGLFVHDGILYESTGLWGQSKLISRDLSTLRVLQSSDLPRADFGEGISLVGNTITQLTYQGGNVYRYSKDNFAQESVTKLPNLDVIKEGWGMTTDGSTLYVSDGSSTLFLLHPKSLRIKSSLPVRYKGYPISNLNELELVGPYIYANVYMTDCAVKINTATGEVVTWIHKGSGFYNTVNAGVDVMNGIAFDHSTNNLYITGKNWPHLYSVQIVQENYGIDSDLDIFCLHRSMSLADFSVMMTLIHRVPSTDMPGLATETTVSPSSSASVNAGPSPEQIRDFFESRQSYFQLPVSPRSLVDFALGDEGSGGGAGLEVAVNTHSRVNTMFTDIASSDEPDIDQELVEQFQRDTTPLRTNSLPNDNVLHPS